MLLLHFKKKKMAGVGMGRVVLLQFFCSWGGEGGFTSFLWLGWGWGGWFRYSFVGVGRVGLLVFYGWGCV